MSLETLLEELRAEPADAARARTEHEFDQIAAPFENRIVVFGTGHLGKLAVSGLRSSGIEPLAFCDNNSALWSSQKDGLLVMSPAQAVELYKDSAAFIVAIYNPSAPRRQLQDLGCTRIVPYPILFWKHWRTMPKEDRLELPHRILEHTSEMAAGYDLLSDERSRREFCAQIRWRCLLDYGCLPPADDARETYFPADVFGLLPGEVFVDCGAFDGDSIRAFLTASGGRFGKIYAWEADSKNCRAIGEYRSGLAPEIAGRMEIVPFAVGARNETVHFCVEGTMGSHMADSGETQEVECRTIDSVLEGAAPTFIKMDIEGAEPDALRGAARTMADCRPVMAVCAYHKCDHLWEIPRLLKSANPDYEIFLRRYAEDCWEIVYYAVPPERLGADSKPEARRSPVRPMAATLAGCQLPTNSQTIKDAGC